MATGAETMNQPPEPSHSVPMSGPSVTSPAPAMVRQVLDHAMSQVHHMNTEMSTASTAVGVTLEDGPSGGEKGIFAIARVQARNKMYMAMPNFTDVGIAGMHFLISELHRLREEVEIAGQNSERYEPLMLDMIDKKIKLDKLRKGAHDGKKLPEPFVSDIEAICRQTRRALPADEPSRSFANVLLRQDRGDWARLSVMTPTEHFVSRLPQVRFASWLFFPARLRPERGSGVRPYSPRIRQFFSVAAEILFIILTWVFGSVPVIIKSLENPNKRLEVLFYSIFFILWTVVTSSLTPNFETRLYLNVGMAALYVQNIRAG